MLHYITLYYSICHYINLYLNILHYAISYYNVLHYITLYGMTWHVMTWHDMTWHNMTGTHTHNTAFTHIRNFIIVIIITTHTNTQCRCDIHKWWAQVMLCVACTSHIACASLTCISWYAKLCVSKHRWYVMHLHARARVWVPPPRLSDKRATDPRYVFIWWYHVLCIMYYIILWILMYSCLVRYSLDSYS